MKEEKEEELKELEKKGYRLIDIVAGDVQPSQEAEHLVKKVAEKKKETFYSDLIYNLASERLPEREAKSLWQEILEHKYMMSEKLGRNVGMRVAVLDYLGNIKKVIEAPKIIEESEFEKTLKLSTTDPLTGLDNRRYFLEQLRECITTSSAEKLKFSFLMMDLDGFKRFNDREGHQAGDLILQETAWILKEGVRKTDIMARYGGDEMSSILPSADKFLARDIAREIREQVKAEFKDIKITLSVGIAEFPSDAGDDEALISRADIALYRAKALRGNAVVYFHPVTITYKQDDPQPQEIVCAGDFNQWSLKAGKMSFDEAERRWTIYLNLLPGKYKYRFLIDGSKWITDPNRGEAAEDGMGSLCSVLRIKTD